MQTEKKNKHMVLQDRIEIQECLSKGMTFKAIAKRVGKDPTTISREIRQHATIHRNGLVKTDESCPLLMKAPFVCNGCAKRTHCSCIYPRRIYIAKNAQIEYQTTLVEAREGIPLNKEEFYRNEQIISDAVRSGQHIFHAIHANKLSVSKSTVYRHIQRGYYSISPIDLPRAVKFKHRTQRHPDFVPKGIKVGRTFADYLGFMEDHPGCNTVEMDSVIGRIGGKVIMTFQFVNVDFMFGLLLDNKTAAETASKIAALKKKLADNAISFGDLFPVLLTDNGGEFSSVSAFENTLAGDKESALFFCDPNAPYQKPHVENNHSLFRSIVPNGSSFDDFSQDTVNLIFSHVNGVLRKQFNGKSAYEMFAFTYSEKLAHLLGVSFVEPRKVIQSPLLLKNSPRW